MKKKTPIKAKKEGDTKAISQKKKLKSGRLRSNTRIQKTNLRY